MTTRASTEHPVVSVTRSGEFALDGELVSSLPELVARLSDALRATGAKHVLFDLREAAAEGPVRRAMEAAKQAGATRFEIKRYRR